MTRAIFVMMSFVAAAGAVRAEEGALSAAEIASAARVDAFTVPTPGEVFAAIGKTGKPAWVSQYREPTPTNFANRYQSALNLGALIADGFIAVEAQDGQQVKNIGRDIMTLAKTLGVSDRVLGRGKSITEFAEHNEWGTLKEELESTQNEVKIAMEEQQDHDLITLVSLGAWIRGTQVVSGLVLKEYTPQAARLLRQPGLVAFFRSKVDALPAKIRDDALVASVSRQLGGLEKMVSFPAGETPTPAAVSELHAAADALAHEIAVRQTTR